MVHFKCRKSFWVGIHDPALRLSSEKDNCDSLEFAELRTIQSKQLTDHCHGRRLFGYEKGMVLDCLKRTAYPKQPPGESSRARRQIRGVDARVFEGLSTALVALPCQRHSQHVVATSKMSTMFKLEPLRVAQHNDNLSHAQ